MPVKCTEPESYTKGTVRQHPENEPGACNQAREDGTPTIQAWGGADVDAATVKLFPRFPYGWHVYAKKNLLKNTQKR